jgi:hypothetical protein
MNSASDSHFNKDHLLSTLEKRGDGWADYREAGSFLPNAVHFHHK